MNKSKLLVLVCFFITFFSHAADVRWSSFGTLALSVSDSSVYGFREDIGNNNGVFSSEVDLTSFSLLGGQVEWELNEHVDFLGQAVYRKLAQPKNKDYITMAFMRVRPSADWSIRLGRVPLDLFNITEYRNINVAYTWAHAPNESYGLLPFKSLDGGDIRYQTRLSSGILSYKFYAGQSSTEIRSSGFQERIYTKNIWGGSLVFEEFDWNLQARYTSAEIGTDGAGGILLAEQIKFVPIELWPDKEQFLNSLLIKGTGAEYISFAGQKNWYNWLFSFELGKILSESDVTADVTTGYISGAYRRGDHTFYGMLAKADSPIYQFKHQTIETFIPELAAGIEQYFNFYSANQQTISVGWRWDINPTVASKLQLNSTHIDQQGATLWLNPTNSQEAKTVTSLMFTLSFAL